MEMTTGEVAILSAAVIFFVRLLWNIERLLSMHVHPDKYGFGNKKTNELLYKNIQAQEQQQTTVVHVMERLDNTIDRLGQFIEKLIEVQTGKPVPPPRTRHD